MTLFIVVLVSLAFCTVSNPLFQNNKIVQRIHFECKSKVNNFQVLIPRLSSLVYMSSQGQFQRGTNSLTRPIPGFVTAHWHQRPTLELPQRHWAARALAYPSGLILLCVGSLKRQGLRDPGSAILFHFLTSHQERDQCFKGTTINHLGGHGANWKKKIMNRGCPKKKSFGGSPKKKFCLRKSAPRPPPRWLMVDP